MTIDEFCNCLNQESAPPGISPALKAMWEDGRGNWSTAHSIAQDIDDRIGSWIHAYLHRKEGDLANASYWYRRAGQPVAHDALQDEWTRIVSALLQEVRA
jgi:hypothetical protein